MPYQVWIATGGPLAAALIGIAMFADELKELRHFRVIAAAVIILGSGLNVTVWMATPTGTKTVADSDWLPPLSGTVDHEMSDLSAVGYPRYVVTDTGYRVLVDNVKPYPKGMRVTFACPRQEWQGHQRFDCRVGAVPTEEVAAGYPSFSAKILLFAVGLALVDGSLVLLLGVLLLRRRSREDEAFVEEGPMNDPL